MFLEFPGLEKPSLHHQIIRENHSEIRRTVQVPRLDLDGRTRRQDSPHFKQFVRVPGHEDYKCLFVFSSSKQGINQMVDVGRT